MITTPDVLHLELPLRTRSLTNARENRWARTKITRAERKATWAVWLQAHGRRIENGETVVVTLTRVAPNSLDAHDNLPASFKACVDQIAFCLGLPNDRDERVTWVYDQERARDYRVHIRVEYFR